jgi:glycosyltransferase involved in cell wall biosynthesis
VPVKNESSSIEKLISSVAAQTRRPDEVVIVDGGSKDGTAEMIESWLGRHWLTDWARVVRLNEASPGKGRNVGIAAARYDWIAFTDAGIRAEPTWLERLIEVAERNDQPDVVYGNYEPMVETFFERCAALAYVAPKHVKMGQAMRGPVIPSSLVRREVWEGVGGFPDLRAAEDLIFMENVQRRGYKIGWAPRATVWWRMPPTFKATFQRFALYSKHNVRIGKQSDWHYGVARQYAVWLVFIALALIFSAWFLLVPAIGVWARAWKGIWTKREGRGLFWSLNPAQLVGVVLVLLTIDAATFVGWWEAIRKRGDAHRGISEEIGSEAAENR